MKVGAGWHGLLNLPETNDPRALDDYKLTSPAQGVKRTKTQNIGGKVMLFPLLQSKRRNFS